MRMVPSSLDPQHHGVIRHKGKEPAISADAMRLGLMGVAGVIWIISLILSISSLFSSTYIRYRTDLLRKEIVPSSCQPTPANDYHLIHIDCPVRSNAQAVFKIPKQFRQYLDPTETFNGGQDAAVFFDMTVEMFQNQQWYNHVLAEREDADAGARRNNGGLILRSAGGGPAAAGVPGGVIGGNYFPYIEGLGRQFASVVYAGNFMIDPDLIPSLFLKKRVVKLKDLHAGNTKFVPDRLHHPPVRLSNTNTRVYNNAIYTSQDPLRPSQGDLRIQFFVNSATHISAIGIQAPLGADGGSSGAKKSPFMRWIDQNINLLLGNGNLRLLMPFNQAAVFASGAESTSDQAEYASSALIVSEGDADLETLLRQYELRNDAFARVHWYALVAFGISTSAMVCFALARCTNIIAAHNVGPVIIAASMIVLAFGSTLLLACIPNLLLRSTWRLGLLQLLSGGAAVFMAYWIFTRGAQIYASTNWCLPDGVVYHRIPDGPSHPGSRSPTRAEASPLKRAVEYKQAPIRTAESLLRKVDEGTELLLLEDTAHNKTYAAV